MGALIGAGALKGVNTVNIFFQKKVIDTDVAHNMVKLLCEKS